MAQTADSREARMEGKFERVFQVTGPATLELKAESGLFRIKRGEAGVVRVNGVLRPKRSWFGLGDAVGALEWMEANPPVEQFGSTIYIRDADADMSSVTILLDIAVPADTQIRSTTDSADLRVEGVDGPIRAQTDSGDLRFSSISSSIYASSDSGSIEISQAMGPVEAKTDSGAIEATEIAGSLEARTDSGEIRVRQSAGALKLRTDSGNIEALSIAKDCQARTDSGNIRVGHTAASPVRARTESGNVEIRLAPGAGYNLRVRTENGEIRIPELSSRGRVSEHEVEGQLQGGGPLIDIQTEDGEVDID